MTQPSPVALPESVRPVDYVLAEVERLKAVAEGAELETLAYLLECAALEARAEGASRNPAKE
jgi:hypothetical protein